jgi:Lipoproteins
MVNEVISFYCFSDCRYLFICWYTTEVKGAKPKILYGTASFYSNSFNGKKTANGEIYSHKKMTAACNVLPLGTG